MLKRLIAGFLWAFTVYSGWELVAGLSGLPSLIGPVAAVALGLLVIVDPGHVIWPTPSRRIAAIPEPQAAGDTKAITSPS